MAAFFSSLFKPKWQHNDAQVRLQAIDQGLDSTTLKTLATEDEQIEVRHAAIKQLEDLSILASLLGRKELKPIVTERYISLALNSDTLEGQLASIRKINDPEIIMTVASESSESALVEAALSVITDEQQLFDFIQNSASAKARQLAIQSINDLGKLKSIEKSFRNKDKSLVKIAKGKIQEATEKEASIAQAKHHTESLLKQAQTLASQAFSPEFVGKLTYLKQQWETAQYTESFSNDFTQAIQTCEAVAKDNEAEQKALEEAKANAQDAQNKHLDALKQAQEIYDDAKSRNNLTASFVSEQLKNIQQTWFEAQNLNKADKALQGDFDALVKPLVNLESSLTALNDLNTKTVHEASGFTQLQKESNRIEKLQRSVNWPKEFANPSIIDEWEKSLQAIQAKIKQLKDSEKDSINQLSTQLDKLESEIAEGNIKQANKLLAQVKKLFSQVDAKKVTKFSQRSQLLQNQLQELQDWKGFAAQPKFEALIHEMEQLQSSSLSPKELANQIHSLQEEWKALGSLGDKKQQNALWTQFKAAADIAYEPCKAFYDDQSKVRQFNKEQREQICAELETLYEQQNWNNANFKALQKIIDKAHVEYKKFAPVDRQVNRDLQQRFNAALGQLKDKLHGYYNENAQDKLDLIDQCNALVEEQDIHAAIERCKLLQQKWKDTENAGRQENELWGKFRAACDEIFARRSAENQAKRAEIDERIAQAEALLANAKELAQGNSANDLAAVDDIKQQINQLDIPVKVKTAILKQVDGSKSALNKSIAAQKSEADRQKWVNAFALSDKLAELEQSQSDLESRVKLINEKELPKGCKEIFIKRTQQTDNSNDAALNELCLELEISLGLESPSEDRDQRMAFQVQLLQQNMGKPNRPRPQQIQYLQQRWFEIQGNQAEYAKYRERFTQGLERAEGLVTESA